MSSRNLLEYSPPAWLISGDELLGITSADSTNDIDGTATWRLDEIKSGVIVGQHSLHGVPLIIFGRVVPESALPDNSQFIITAHESCSRLHARIAFDQSGLPWLRDLGSNNGTFVNKKKLPPLSIGRHENGSGEGSRGVRLYPGDVIQFAASTRCFILEGPQKYDRNYAKVSTSNNKPNQVLQKYETQQDKRSEAVTSKADQGVSWGIDMEGADQEQDLEDDADLSLLDASAIPVKHRKLYDKINEKKYKLANILAEIERIRRKETFSALSDGQLAQITKNQNKEQDLVREIHALECDLRSKLKGDDINGTTAGSRARKKRRMHEDVEDEDSAFYDRTLKPSTSGPLNDREGVDASDPEVVETEQSLKDKWIKLYSLFNKRRQDTERLLGMVQDVEKEIQEYTLKNHGDLCDEDLFFLHNDLTIAKDRWKLASENERNIENELSSVESLLHVIDNHYICDKKKLDLWVENVIFPQPKL